MPELAKMFGANTMAFDRLNELTAEAEAAEAERQSPTRQTTESMAESLLRDIYQTDNDFPAPKTDEE